MKTYYVTIRLVVPEDVERESQMEVQKWVENVLILPYIEPNPYKLNLIGVLDVKE